MQLNGLKTLYRESTYPSEILRRSKRLACECCRLKKPLTRGDGTSGPHQYIHMHGAGCYDAVLKFFNTGGRYPRACSWKSRDWKIATACVFYSSNTEARGGSQREECREQEERGGVTRAPQGGLFSTAFAVHQDNNYEVRCTPVRIDTVSF